MTVKWTTSIGQLRAIEEMDEFLEKYNIPKLNQEEIEDL